MRSHRKRKRTGIMAAKPGRGIVRHPVLSTLPTMRTPLTGSETGLVYNTRFSLDGNSEDIRRILCVTVRPLVQFACALILSRRIETAFARAYYVRDIL